MAGEFALLLTVVLVGSLASLARMARAAAASFKTIREELAATPVTQEMRFTITETVVSWNDGKVVALPVRQPRLARPILLPAQLSEAA